MLLLLLLLLLGVGSSAAGGSGGSAATAGGGRWGAALHLTESIETKCKDLVFTFFVLSKQSALFGR